MNLFRVDFQPAHFSAETAASQLHGPVSATSSSAGGASSVSNLEQASRASRIEACRNALSHCSRQHNGSHEKPPVKAVSKRIQVSKLSKSKRQAIKLGGKSDALQECEQSRGGKAYSLMQPCYPNEAVEREMTRVDRWLVDSLAFVNTFDGYSIGQQSPTSTSQQTKPITMVVLTVNRQIPYLAVLVTTLLRGHDTAKLLESTRLHFVNIERRPCKCHYSLFEDLDARLPFATFHHWTDIDESVTDRHSTLTNSTDHPNDKARYYRQYKADYIRAMQLCKSDGSGFCLILEEDVALTAQLIPKFIELTCQLKGEFDRSNLGVLSLYYPENEILNKNGKSLIYGGGDPDQYERDITAAEFMVDVPRSRDDGGSKIQVQMSDNMGLFQAKSTPTKRIKYRLEENDRGYGAVALAFPNERLEEIMQYVTDKMISGDDDEEEVPLDVTIMNLFHEERNYTKLKVTPSLVQHIGFYSEHRGGDDWAQEDPSWRLFKLMSRDVRFHLSEGHDNTLS